MFKLIRIMSRFKNILLIEKEQKLYFKLFKLLTEEKYKLLVRKTEKELIKLFNEKTRKVHCIVLNLARDICESTLPERICNITGNTPIVAVGDNKLLSTKY